MITIKEIAEMMNVSPTTVANVIHGRTNKVSPQNIERIQKALKEYNYVPKMGLETLTKGKSRLILVVIYLSAKYSLTYLSDPFYGYITGVLEKMISETGYYMMLYISKENDNIMTTAMSWNVAGMITITFSYKNFKKLSALVTCPVVGIDTYATTDYPELNTGHHVKLDDTEAGRLMGKHLISQGYKNIIVLSDDMVGSAIERANGIYEVMKSSNLPCEEPWFFYLNPLDKSSYEQLQQFFPFAGKDYVFFCNSDQFAFSVIGYLTRYGFHIPKDFSVCGFDDNFYAESSNPQLTTVHQDITEKAKIAVELLMQLIAGKEVDDSVIYLPVNIVSRNSTKCLSASSTLKQTE